MWTEKEQKQTHSMIISIWEIRLGVKSYGETKKAPTWITLYISNAAILNCLFRRRCDLMLASINSHAFAYLKRGSKQVDSSEFTHTFDQIHSLLIHVFCFMCASAFGWYCWRLHLPLCVLFRSKICKSSSSKITIVKGIVTDYNRWSIVKLRDLEHAKQIAPKLRE